MAPKLKKCGCSSMVEFQPSKLAAWVRFPSPAPQFFLPRGKIDERLICACSSVGQSNGLLSRVSGVRISSGAPNKRRVQLSWLERQIVALEVVSSILVARPIYFLGCRQAVKAPDFDSGIRKFKSCHPSQQKQNVLIYEWLKCAFTWPISSVGRAPDF